jgi:Zn-dependent peptidase ImmA (M78 family)
MKRPRTPNKAREEARKLLAKHRITSIPVPVERIAKEEGIKVEYAPLDGELSGFAHIREGVTIVGINSLHASSRQRFTLAHELGHVFLHRSELEKAVHVDKGSLRRDAMAAAGIDPLEIDANAFASELLMPQGLLAEALAGKTIDLENDEMVTSLARRFRVSEAALRFRLELP